MMENTLYVEKKYITKNTVELRRLSETFAMYANEKNTMAPGPSNRPKQTVVALHFIAEF